MSEFRIFRYRLPITDSPEVRMPYGAKTLSVAPSRSLHDSEVLDLWALVDIEEPVVPHWFRVIGTGHLIPELPGRFIGTVSLLAGAFIGHVFEVATDPSVLDAS